MQVGKKRRNLLVHSTQTPYPMSLRRLGHLRLQLLGATPGPLALNLPVSAKLTILLLSNEVSTTNRSCLITKKLERETFL
jgi:hypothetical protein